ncbi:MAG TPA: CPBP family glutamic-type intramembrane protease [Polyangiaceae bacterium]
MAETQAQAVIPAPSRDNGWTDIALTLPIFLLYHAGVVFLPTRNAADLVTSQLMLLAERSLLLYMTITASVGVAVVVLFLLLGQKRALRWQRFAMIAVEGILYAVALRVIAGYVVGELRLDAASPQVVGLFPGLVMSLGAGFYEELVFRVALFTLLGRLAHLAIISKPAVWKSWLFWLIWALLTSFLFSSWHHVGELGEPFTMRAFVFRWVCGMVFTAIFALRGYATAVWTHTLYDIWVLVL